MALNPTEFELLTDSHRLLTGLDTRFEALEKEVAIHRLTIFGNGAWGLKANVRLALWLVVSVTGVLVLIAAGVATAHFTGG